MESIKEGEYNIIIKPDTDIASPLELDSVGQFICFHKRYNLGHKHSYRAEDFSNWENMKEYFEKRGLNGEPVALMLKLYLDAHSGIGISILAEPCTSCFTPPIWISSLPAPMHDISRCDWIGFVIATRKAVTEQMGIRRLDKKVRERIYTALMREVNIYDMYCRNDIWCYAIQDSTGKTLDAHGEIYGYDYCIEEAIAATKRLREIIR